MANRLVNVENSPYVGPRPFEQKDRNLFYGRDNETMEIVSLILSNPLTLIYSQSGVGKTSLFNTKILYDLEKQYNFKTFPSARVRSLMSPEKIPKEVTNMYMFNALLSLKPDSDVETIKNQSLSNFLKQDQLRRNEGGKSFPRVIVFDQMEELFGLYPENWLEDQQDFFQQIAQALNEDNLLRIVFVIREEYLAHLSSFAELVPGRLRARFRLERLGKQSALRAVLEPLKQTSGFIFAPGIAEKLVDDLLTMRVETIFGKTVDMKGEYVEPVHLQVVCQRLWMKVAVTGITEITQEHLKGSADVNQALTEFYLDIVADAARHTGVSKDTIRNWFNQYLITSSGTRGIVHREEKSTGDLPNKVVDFLQQRYLIRQEWRSGSRWYELTHDRLIGPIRESNKEWKEKKKVKKLTVSTVLLSTAIIAILIGYYITLPGPGTTKTGLPLFIEQRIVPVGSTPANIAVDQLTGLVYVANSGSNTLSTINGTTHKIMANIAVGRSPNGVAVDPYAGLVYVTNQANDTLSVINGTTNKITANVVVGRSPNGVAVDPYAHLVYVTNQANDTLSVINGTTNKITANIAVGRSPNDVAIDPYAHLVYVTNQANDTLSVINGTTNKVIRSLPVGNEPHGASVDPYSGIIYVTNQANDTLSVINGTTNKITANIAVGRSPNDVAIDPISNRIYVTNQANDTLSVINGTTNKVIRSLPVGNEPYGASVDPYSGMIYVANKMDGTIFVMKLGDTRNQPPFRVSYQGTLSPRGLFAENFSNPASVEYSGSNNRIYVADLDNNRIQVFDTKGILHKIWGTKGNATGQFNHPGDVAVDPVTGYVFVSDIENNRIEKFDSEGGFIEEWGSPGNGNGQFNHPGDIVINPEKRFVYVVDDHNNRIQKFDTSGKFISKWGSVGTSNGQFRFPTGITVDRSGMIYVADTFNNRIQKFDENGQFVAKWGSTKNDVFNFDRPDGLTYDVDSGLLYISDRKNGRIVVLTDTGKPFYDIVLSAATGGLKIKPRDVSLDMEGKLYVADKDNNRIHVFTTRFPTGFNMLPK